MHKYTSHILALLLSLRLIPFDYEKYLFPYPILKQNYKTVFCWLTIDVAAY